MTCQDTAPALGAYVLGALDAEERRRVDEHVRGCRDCATELAGFQGLPPLLDRVSLEELEAAPVTPSPDLFERVVAAAAADTAHRSHPARRWLVAAAAVAALGAGVGVTTWVTSSPSPQQGVSVVAGNVHMTVRPDAQPDGTVLDVTVAGVPPGEECRLVVLDQNGGRHQAGAWTASYAGDATFHGWTAVQSNAVAAVLLLGTDGHELARLPL